MAEVQGIERLVAELTKRQAKAINETRRKAVVGYTAEYAVYVHENLEAFHPVGEAKFLEKPIRQYKRDMAKMIAREIANGTPPDQALLKTGLLLQGLSQDLCPVDTGFLRSSAFTELR